MARKPLQRKKIVISNNSFLDIAIPTFDWINVSFSHQRSIEFRDENDILKSSDDYQIVIDMSKKMIGEDKELSKKIKDVTKLSFAPYNWSTKSYNFYTNERTGSIDDKKNILSSLLQVLKKYEIDSKNNFTISKEMYEDDIKNNYFFENAEILVKIHKPTNKFIVLAKGFLGSQQYGMLRSISEYNSNLVKPEEITPLNENQYLLSTDFFKEEMKNKKIDKKTYFVVGDSQYYKLKEYISNLNEKQEQFIEEQKVISNNKNLSNLDIEEDNIFDLKIKFNENEQCFSFYGKGYFDSSSFYGTTQRNILGLWALNFIYSDEEKFPGVESDGYYNNEVIVPNKDKIILEKTIGGSKKDKDVRVPASEWKKIERIKKNYEEVMKFWGRKNKDIKITHCDFSSYGLLSRIPLVYIDNKGGCFFAYGSRRMGHFKSISTNNDSMLLDPIVIQSDLESGKEEKNKRNIKFSQTLKTIPISYEEAKFFLDSHPFSDKIKKDSITLNSVIHAGSLNHNQLSYEERLNIFNTVLLMAEMASQTKDMPQVNKKKIKI